MAHSKSAAAAGASPSLSATTSAADDTARKTSTRAFAQSSAHASTVSSNLTSANNSGSASGVCSSSSPFFNTSRLRSSSASSSIDRACALDPDCANCAAEFLSAHNRSVMGWFSRISFNRCLRTTSASGHSSSNALCSPAARRRWSSTAALSNIRMASSSGSTVSAIALADVRASPVKPSRYIARHEPCLLALRPTRVAAICFARSATRTSSAKSRSARRTKCDNVRMDAMSSPESPVAGCSAGKIMDGCKPWSWPSS
mmetsp:Transcript_1319/g.4789  ORF Transcript_1319/g.4789 Transcript_1319/m.4789 type:complete len:258 (-) Transcript_1319:1324-2097(-)